jgi:hypothetical protein
VIGLSGSFPNTEKDTTRTEVRPAAPRFNEVGAGLPAEALREGGCRELKRRLQVRYSLFNVFAGFIIAALRDCVETVIRAMNNTMRAAAPNVHQVIEIR